MAPPKVKTPFRPVAIQRPKKGLQYCQTHQDSYTGLKGAGEDLHDLGWRFWEAGQQSTEMKEEEFGFVCKALHVFTLWKELSAK